MKYLTYSFVSLALFSLMACGHGRPADSDETTGTENTVTPVNSTGQTPTTPVDFNSQTGPTSATPTLNAVAGLNPEHGQPGHSCDIAVGAPLNSPPAQQTPPAISTPQTSPINFSTENPPAAATATTVAPGMNPAHGQPGHRCDIAVGAPLNSKPAAEPAKEITPPKFSLNQPIKTEATTAVAPGMNPAHGQPGHRCDIAVGEPLSTPKNPNYTPPAKEIIPPVVPVKLPPDSTGK